MYYINKYIIYIYILYMHIIYIYFVYTQKHTCISSVQTTTQLK